jgi:hypothetical protein
LADNINGDNTYGLFSKHGRQVAAESVNPLWCGADAP